MVLRCLSVAEWNSYVASYDFGSVKPSRVVLHHTYIPTLAQWHGVGSMRSMQTFYGRKGWTAAPHVYCGPDGIWLSTPMHDIGIHAGTGNSGRVNGKLWYSIGLEMVGYYDKVLPSGPVWENSLAVMGGLSRRLSIVPRQLISFHRDYTNLKSCPGWAVTKEWVFGQVEAWLRLDTESKTVVVKPGGGTLRSAPLRIDTTIVRNAIAGERLTVLNGVAGQGVNGNTKWLRVSDTQHREYVIHESAVTE